MGGRPTKQGIDFFSVDVVFDEKIEMYLIEKESAGLSVLITIWQLIYKNSGYYIVNDDDLYLMVKNRISLPIEVIKDCVYCALNRGIFDKNQNQKNGILTSRGVQKRFFSAAAKKKHVVYNPDYLLVSVLSFGNLINSNINAINSNINAINSAGNLTKGEEKEEGEENLTRILDPDFDTKIQTLWIKTFGRNPKIPEREETEKLIKKFGEGKVYEIYKQASLKNFRSLAKLISCLDEYGNIKPFEDSNGKNKPGSNKNSQQSRSEYRPDPERAKRNLEEYNKL